MLGRPLVRHRRLSIASLVLHLTAFLLLLLVALSLPIIKAIYLVSLQAQQRGPLTSIATELRFGVWGVCASSALNTPSWYTNPGLCFGPQLGYTVPPAYLSAAKLPPEVASVLLESILVVLVLHPIAAAFSFLALLFSLYLSSQAVSICGLITSIIASLLTTILFAVDLTVALVVKSKVDEFTGGGFVVTPGNAVWMTLAAAILSWAGVVLLSARVCFCCGI